LASLPVALGLLTAAAVGIGRLENHRIYLAAQLAFAAPLVGLFFSGCLSLVLAIHRRAQRGMQRGIAAQRARAAEERRRFLRRLDHELKNPLTAIRTGLSNLSWLSSPEARQETLDTMHAQVLRLSRLAGDLRKLADLEIRPLESTRVAMGPLLEEVMEQARERSEEGERQLRLTMLEAPWPLPTVEGDPDLLFLAVHNLVDNALKFTAPGDTVEVRAFEDSTRLVLEVADTGPGIPQEELPHVWKELYRGQETRGIPGSGLGLALVKAICQRHGGDVSVRSRSGQGTVFTIRLPV
jgi:two-component system OmpR family sensor kinase